MIRLRLQAVVALAAMLLAGCAHHGSVFTPAEVADDGRALLYVYRPAQFSNAMLSPTVVIDGEAVFDTHSGAYAVLSIAAGTHHLVLESEQRLTGNDELVVQFESGQVSYLRVDTALKFETDKPYTRHFSLVRVAERTALREIAQCRQQQSRLPSKYLWPVEARDAHADDDAQTDEPATFTIDKSSNPFAVKRSHE